MSPYSHLDLIQERYPQAGCLRVYQALRLAIRGRGADVDWGQFEPQDWALLGQMAGQDGVAELLYQAWRDGGRPRQAPARLVAELGAGYRRSQEQAAARERELFERIEPALARAGQRLILLKGAALAWSLYDSPALRPMVDIDCLAAQNEIAEIKSTLENVGYTQDKEGLVVPGVEFFEYHLVMRYDGPPAHMLELHHTLIAAKDEYFHLDTDWFLAQSEPMRGSLWTLRPAAHMLHLAAHLMLHHGEGESDLLHFYDIALLLERWGDRIDWDWLRDEARRMNLDYAVYAALQGCAERFAITPPAPFQQEPREREAARVREFIETRRRPIPPTHTERYLKKLANRPLWMQAALALQFAFPQPEFMRRRYGLKPAWLWPLAYPLRWAIGLGHLWTMATRKRNNP